MAAFASYRRSGWVRLLVLILCALFILATIGAPPAQALGVESVAVFGLASVLSAVTAALGFKLSSNEQGQATLQKMVQDFKTVAWATGFVLVGSKLNGLQNGMDYIKMQVQNGKTYLDARVFAWVQQWLAQNGVYDNNIFPFDYASSGLKMLSFQRSIDLDQLISLADASYRPYFYKIINKFSIVDTDSLCFSIAIQKYSSYTQCNIISFSPGSDKRTIYYGSVPYVQDYGNLMYYQIENDYFGSKDSFLENFVLSPVKGGSTTIWALSNYGRFDFSSNDSGLTGTDTLGKDVVDLTLDQILEKLKEWAQDWFDAGADSATNSATGALDLPLTVATGAATANPSIAEDGPLVWFPPFSIPIPNLRTGETDTNTVDQGKENASSVETSTDVAENQSVIDSLVNWALNYISPDTGLFSKFPLCVPYDAYLLVTSSLGVDAVGSDSIFGASPGDLDGVVSQDTETYSDFQPIINIKHDFELDGVIYPLDVTIDLTPWQPLVTFFREGMALLLVAELIGAEFKRIRGH